MSRALPVSLTSTAPLFPQGPERTLWANPKASRDVQLWPRHLRDAGAFQTLHRTAQVKHPLRAMADRTEMLTTYEHDFGYMVRPKDDSDRLSTRSGQSHRSTSVPGRSKGIGIDIGQRPITGQSVVSRK
mmetsp:Transcript_10532/g.15774  ORF Transcript_10532/g.15774 Transcript_10532/m.15774 type:complete len:129 (+) Transcript_10532:120-506(+)